MGSRRMAAKVTLFEGLQYKLVVSLRIQALLLSSLCVFRQVLMIVGAYFADFYEWYLFQFQETLPFVSNHARCQMV